MNDAQLNQAKDPLQIIAESGELSSRDKSLSVNAKRNFLAGFWARRDPTPDTPETRRGRTLQESGLRKPDLSSREP